MRSVAVPLLLSTILAPTAADGHMLSTSIINTSHPWWIISTSTSRHGNKGLYLDAKAKIRAL